VVDCKRGERKHQLAEEYLASHPVGTGVFLILVARCAATVWDVHRSTEVIGNIAKKTAFVNHYSFHIMDPQWGHVTIKMSGHPPFAAQVIPGRPRVRRRSSQRGGDRLYSTGQLLHRSGRPRGPGSGRRHLAATRDDRASQPGLRPVDLFGLPVLRPGPSRASPQRLPLRVRGLPGRVHPAT
jgi:hypothetical protein